MKENSDWRDFLKLIGKKQPSTLLGTLHTPGAASPEAASNARVIYFPHFSTVMYLMF